jgi:hypothetical protein
MPRGAGVNQCAASTWLASHVQQICVSAWVLKHLAGTVLRTVTARIYQSTSACSNIDFPLWWLQSSALAYLI